MISAKPMAVVAMLALAGVAVAQDKFEEQRIANLIEQLKGHDYQQVASWELVTIGAPAVPALIHVLEAESSEPVLLKVITTLGRMRAEAVPALPALTNLLARRVVSKTALTAVGDIGPHSGQDSSNLGKSLVQAFRSYGVMNPRFVEYGPLSLPYFYVRAVSRLEIDPSSSTDLLLDLLHSSDDPYAVAFAAQLLGKRGAEASRLVPHLERCAEEARTRGQGDVLLAFEGVPSVVLKRADWREAYFAATEALARIAPLTPEAIAGHRLRLRGGGNVRPEYRISSVSALVILGSSAVVEAVPELVAAARSENTPLASEAITALGMIGPAAKEAIPTLEKLTEHDDPQIAERAKAALRQVRGR